MIWSVRGPGDPRTGLDFYAHREGLCGAVKGGLGAKSVGSSDAAEGWPDKSGPHSALHTLTPREFTELGQRECRPSMARTPRGAGGIRTG